MVSAEITNISIDVRDDYFEEIFKDHPKYWPFRINVTSEHAGYVEFGTQGESDGRKRAAGNNEFFENLKTWLYERGASMYAPGSGLWALSGQSETELNRIAYAVMMKIIKEGSPPQPFIRPAVHTIEKFVEDGMYTNGDMEQIAQDLVSEMYFKLKENHTLYGSEEILRSIQIEWLEPGSEIETGSTVMVGGKPVDERIWASDYADLKGNTERAKNRDVSRLRF